MPLLLKFGRADFVRGDQKADVLLADAGMAALKQAGKGSDLVICFLYTGTPLPCSDHLV